MRDVRENMSQISCHCFQSGNQNGDAIYREVKCGRRRGWVVEWNGRSG